MLFPDAVDGGGRARCWPGRRRSIGNFARVSHLRNPPLP
jgi:hypothetical protein